MATANGNHPLSEGNITRSTVSTVEGDKNHAGGPYTPPPIGIAAAPTSYGTQGPYISGPPPQGNFGQPPPTFGIGPPGTQGMYGPPQPIHGPPVINQPAPGGQGWMHMPQHVVPNCPPGLEYLTMIDQLLVHQEIQVLPTSTRYENENKFTIHNSLGQKVYSAVESSDACLRNCCGSFRPFELKIMDNYGKTIMQLNRPFACQGCCCPCFLQKMEVFAPPGTLIGTVDQEWSFWVPKFAIKNPTGDVILRIGGPCCTMACCGGDVDFKVLTSDSSNQVGKISKKWAGYAKENADADNFGINFPMDLDVKMKAVMLGACFLIDMMYYEHRGKQNPPTNTQPSTASTNTNVNRV